MSADSAASTASRKPSYRPDIQGLRALAVLGVLVFHAQAPLPAGFLGVDVFFVISGYVITGLILRRSGDSGRVPWREFYARRFLRLGPALSVMLFSTLVASYFLSSPFGVQQSTGATAIGAVFLASNMVLVGLAGDYFAAPAQFNPLLHTWSVSVEEQIYLLIPALIVAFVWLNKWSVRRVLTWILPITGLLSLVLTIAAATDRIPAFIAPVVNYYSAATRLWEFAAGGVVAIFGSHLVASPRIARLVGSLGAVAIVLAFALLDESKRYPGPWTLVPVCGTALLLWAGEFSTTGISRLLGDKRLVWIGDRSYSLYLWHWPMVAFAVALWPTRWYAAGIATLLSILVAVIVFRWVENPIRLKVTPPRKRLALMVVGFAGVPLIAGFLLIRSADAEWETRSSQLPIGELRLTESGQQCAAGIRGRLGPPSDPDLYCSGTGSAPVLAVVGDSHAARLRPGFAAIPGVEEVINLGVAGSSFSDPRFDPVFKYLKESPTIKRVVITSGWQFQGVPLGELERELRGLTESGKRVYVLTDVPIFVGDAMRCVVRRLPVGDDTCSIPTEVVRAEFAPVLDQLRQLRSRVPGLSLVDTSEYLCTAGFCSMIYQGVPVYADNHHLNSTGAVLFVSRLLEEVPDLR